MNDENPTASDSRRPLGKLRAALVVCVAVAMLAGAWAIASVAVSRMPVVFARRASSRDVRASTAARPEWRLENLLMQRRARWLLARVDELFVE